MSIAYYYKLFAALTLSTIAFAKYRPPCVRALGDLRPVNAEVSEARARFDAAVAEIPGHETEGYAAWFKVNEETHSRLLLDRADLLCRLRGVEIERNDNEIVIFPVIGVSPLNDYAYFQFRLYRTLVVYNPFYQLKMNRPDSEAVAGHVNNLARTFISHGAVREGRPTKSEYHESDHARQFENLRRGILSIFQGEVLNPNESLQEYANYTRDLNRLVMELQRLVKIPNPDAFNLAKRVDAFFEIIVAIESARENTDLQGFLIQKLLAQKIEQKEVILEKKKPVGGSKDILWATIPLREKKTVLRIPVLSLLPTEAEPAWPVLNGLITARLDGLGFIESQFQMRLLELEDRLYPPGFDFKKAAEGDPTYHKAMSTAIKVKAQSLTPQDVDRMAAMTTQWWNDVEVKMSISFGQR